MTMDQHRTLRVLEFPKILDRLAGFCLTELGKEKCLTLIPATTLPEVERYLQETEEANTLLHYMGGNPLVSFSDIRPLLTMAQKGGCLSPKGLLEVASSLRSARSARSALVKEREDTPILHSVASQLTTMQGLESDIENAIVSEEEIADRASSDLLSIRREIRNANERMRSKLNQMIRSQSFSKYLQDPIITKRGERYCIPERAEHRSQVPGLVHDQSASGATLFIEPMAIVELGNDIKQLHAKEQLEISRILRALTDQLIPYTDQLIANIQLLTHLDFAFAKGQLARTMKAVCPKMNTNGYLRIVRGRHPLIDPAKVVPSDLWLGDAFTSLIITGPNTGGKTVTLKTVGLFTLMAQAGLHLPADYGTEMAVFTTVYADIGDEQSIEQSLSTFSSHMTNIVSILNHVTDNDLVLFDELGAGTDPTEGAAIAQCILRLLLERKIRTMATTHYSELKAFALSTVGVENASVEFDVESLRPTYRLSIGIPGKSNAFDISRKLGLSEQVIEEAKTLLSQNDIRFEDVIANAEYHRQVAERERTLAEQTRRETVKLRNEAEALRKEVNESRQKSLQKAKEEGKRILENAKREADSIISDLKALRKQAQTPEHEVQRLKKRMEEGIGALSEGLRTADTSNFTPPKNVKIGDNVEIVHLKTKGTIIALPNARGEVQVKAGIMKINVHLSQLRMIDAPKPPKTQVSNRVNMSAKAAVAMEVDVRGMNLEEATQAVDAYLADATLAGLHEVSIIHGKGTGVLRVGLQRHLKKHMQVKKYRDGVYGEGEQGVTIVTLK